MFERPYTSYILAALWCNWTTKFSILENAYPGMWQTVAMQWFNCNAMQLQRGRAKEKKKE